MYRGGAPDRSGRAGLVGVKLCSRPSLGVPKCGSRGDLFNDHLDATESAAEIALKFNLLYQGATRATGDTPERGRGSQDPRESRENRSVQSCRYCGTVRLHVQRRRFTGSIALSWVNALPGLAAPKPGKPGPCGQGEIAGTSCPIVRSVNPLFPYLSFLALGLATALDSHRRSVPIARSSIPMPGIL